MLLVGNGRMVTRTDANPFYENGAVAMDGNTIVAVGTTADLKAQYPDAEYIDAKGKLIMPAMINCHEHIYSSFARGLNIKGYAGTSFFKILDGLWWTIDRNLDNEMTKLSAQATFVDSIKCGVTTTFDHHASFGEIPGSLFAIEEAAKEAGVRACLCYETSDRDGEELCDAAIKENVDFIKHALADDSDMIAGMFGMHAQFTLSDKTLNKCREVIPEGVGYHIHVAEGIEDLHLCLKDHSKRIVDRLYDFDILGEKTLLGHCIYVDDHEMDLIRDTNTMVVHNPESNMGNACGCPPSLAILHKGIVEGLGTDGYTHDMFESYKVAKVLHQHNLHDATCAWAEIPEMLFTNNAKIANRYFKKKLGVLEVGASADVIVIDYDPLTPMNETNINGHLLFGVSGHDVVTTIGNGKVLMKNRELTGLDEEKIMAECRVSAKKLADKINCGR